MKKHFIQLSLFFLLALTTIAFYPSLKNGFTNWDDDKQLTQNNTITRLSLPDIGTYFTSFHDGLYHPLVTLSFAIEYHFFKLNPKPYHITNLILHLLNILFVFWLIYLLSKKAWTALITALLFAIHPLHVASVAWIAERKDVLYTFFFLGSLISYLYYKERNTQRYFIYALILFILSLLSKPMAITLPVILILIDYYIDGKLTKKSVTNTLSFFVLALSFGIITLIARFTRIIDIEPTLHFFDNIFIASYGILFYLVKMVFPYPLSCYYPTPEKIAGMLPMIFYISPCIVALLAVLILYSLRYTKVIFFGFLFYIITISPVLHLIGGGPIVANHYTYVPLIGIFFILGSGAAWFIKQRSAVSIFLICALSIITIILSFLTWQRTQVYKDSITLWEDFFKNYGHCKNISIAYNNRGNAYQDNGYLDKAIANYNSAINLNPTYTIAYNNRGNIYQLQRKYKEALADCNRAIGLNPKLAEAYYNRGNACINLGSRNLAIADYKKAVELMPQYAEAWNNMGNIYQEEGKHNRALECYTKALHIKPVFPQALYNRGNCLMYMQDHKNALNDYSKAVQYNPRYYEAYVNRGIAYFSLGKNKEALQNYTYALTINPQYAIGYINRALVYNILKKYEDAHKDVKRFEQLGYTPPPDFIKELREKLDNK
ncbi:MAG: tetratricopeptide repeat protein [Candidatus Ancaeobacter aquaticus]|nr:tetratricopeptide repeat protein [Candidatus Ancaeobacter aquaticus]